MVKVQANIKTKLADKVYAISVAALSIVSVLFLMYNTLVALIISLLILVTIISKLKYEYFSKYMILALISSITVVTPYLSFLGDILVLIIYLVLFTLLILNSSISLEYSKVKLGFLGPALIYIIVLHIILYMVCIYFIEEYLILPISSTIILMLLVMYVATSLTRLKVNFTNQITLYRDTKREFIIQFYNKSFMKVKVIVLGVTTLDPIVKVYFESSEITLNPNEDYKLPILVKAISMGNTNIRLDLMLKDTLSLLALTRRLHSRIRVLPRSTIIYEGIRKALRGVLGEIGATGRGLVSLGQLVVKRLAEFYAAREYVPGDPPSLIYWKKSLKHHKLIVKELRGAGGAEIVIIADIASSSIDELDDLIYKLLSILLYLSTMRHHTQVYVSVRANGKPLYEPRHEENVVTALINLYNVLSKIDYREIRFVKSIIDSPHIGYIDKGLSEGNQTLIGIITHKLIDRYKAIGLNNLIVDILKITRGAKPIVILLIGNTVVKHVYAVLKYLLVSKGYEVREI